MAEFIEEGKNENFSRDGEFKTNVDLDYKPSIWINRVYPIARMEYFINSIKIWGITVLLGIFMSILLSILHINVEKQMLLVYILTFPIAVVSGYLSVMNVAKRMYDLAWAKNGQEAVIKSILILILLPWIPVLGSIALLIIALILLFKPSADR